MNFLLRKRKGPSLFLQVMLQVVWYRNVVSLGWAFPSKHLNTCWKTGSLISRATETSLYESLDFHERSVDDIENIYVISDLHTDKSENLNWLKERCKNKSEHRSPGKNDALIIAGDISHELSKLKETFSVILDELSCHVFFVWGNHEAWVGGREMDALGIQNSIEKIDAIKTLCKEMGVRTEIELVGNSHESPVCILPIESWYDGTLALEGCEDLCSKFNTWPWVDFVRCRWPEQDSLIEWAQAENLATPSILDREIENTGRIPLGLTDWLAVKNDKTISVAKDIYNSWAAVEEDEEGDRYEMREKKRKLPGLITYSHFLPNEKTLPDWKDPHCETFQRDEWLDHPVPEVSAKFAKVSGSALIDEQIRSILPSLANRDGIKEGAFQHLHIFGHSHRPKDFVFNGVRYVHNPLGKPFKYEIHLLNEYMFFIISLISLFLHLQSTREASRKKNEHDFK